MCLGIEEELNNSNFEANQPYVYYYKIKNQGILQYHF